MVKLFNKLGPGLLYAGAAVGVSHLVQSTKAGGNYGFQLLIFVVIANILKYPFFEFAPRFTLSRKKSIIEGYNELGKWAVWLFFGLTILTMFTIQAAVTLVTSALIKSIFNLNWNLQIISLIVIVICAIIIIIGKYATLDRLMKFIIILLSISTFIATIFAISNTAYFKLETTNEFTLEQQHLTFLIALIGWMPAPIDISIWQSIWNLEKLKQTRISLKDSLVDFNIGYWTTTVLAILFLSLGALTMYGSAIPFSPKGTVFVNQVIDMYTNTIGNWSYPIIAIAALTTMFSTTLTCFDAFPRTLTPTIQILRNQIVKGPRLNQKLLYLSIVGIGALIIIFFLLGNMGTMIKIATTLSFLTAPVLAYLNYRLIYSSNFPKEDQPYIAIKLLAILGLFCLSSFAIWYITTLI